MGRPATLSGMKVIFLSVLAMLGVSAGASAAAISFSGTVTESAGIYLPGAPVGTPVSATIELLSAGSDQNPDPAIGQYSLLLGTIRIYLAGVELLNLDASLDPLVLLLTDTAEDNDVARLVGSLNGNTSVELNFLGLSNFLDSDAFPPVINWAAFTSGDGIILTDTGGSVLTAVGEDGVAFDIESASDVPEPGSALLAGLGLAGLALRMRQLRSKA